MTPSNCVLRRLTTVPKPKPQRMKMANNKGTAGLREVFLLVDEIMAHLAVSLTLPSERQRRELVCVFFNDTGIRMTH